MTVTSPPALIMTILLGACASLRPINSEEDAINTQVVCEVRRICALPKPERDAEIERVKKEFEIVVNCDKR